jgi:hydroxymethylglutaryl-CoA lyase
MPFPTSVTLVEVGPRDGLQNEKKPVSLDDKRALIDRLVDAGLRVIEAGSFVSKRHVPQMANSAELFNSLDRRPGIRHTALTPNLRGLDDALAAGVENVAVFAAVTEGFSQRNLNCSVAESLTLFHEVTQRALDNDMRVRGYLSCVLGCPYDGRVAPATVSPLARQLLDMGCYEVSLGDTIGVGTPGSTAKLLEHLLGDGIDAGQLALHCHDTYGQALANITIALQHDIATIDASVAGLGGCPFAPGASGNVATEDVVYLLDGLNIKHGVNLDKLIDTGSYISALLGRENQSRAARAIIARRQLAGADK